jgi:hypothetical protein
MGGALLYRGFELALEPSDLPLGECMYLVRGHAACTQYRLERADMHANSVDNGAWVMNGKGGRHARDGADALCHAGETWRVVPLPV